MALNTLVVSPAVDELEGVVDAILELLVAAEHEERAGHVTTSPVEAVLVVLGLVDELGPDLQEGLGVPLGGDTDVELVGDLHIHAGLHSDLRFLVVLDIGLSAKKNILC